MKEYAHAGLCVVTTLKFRNVTRYGFDHCSTADRYVREWIQGALLLGFPPSLNHSVNQFGLKAWFQLLRVD